MSELRVDSIGTDFFQDSHEDLVDEFSMDRPRDGAQFCKFTPLFLDSLTQTDWELHQEDKMSDPDMDWIPPSIPSLPDPQSLFPVCSDNGGILQENTHPLKETISRADVLTVPFRDEPGSLEGDESIFCDDHFDGGQEPSSKQFRLNLEDYVE